MKLRGVKKMPEWWVWQGMLRRCRNPNAVDYHRYGGRGIRVCKRWQVFKNFLDDMGPRPEGLTLERINNNRGYSPKNCRWASLTEQARNKSNNKWITIRGETKCLKDWLLLRGMRDWTYRARLNRGMTHEQALFSPAAKRERDAHGRFT